MREIRGNARKNFSSEEKVRIVLEGLRSEVTIAELCRREGIHPNMDYKWSKDFLEAGKACRVGDARCEADSQEVNEMSRENEQLKALVAELSLKKKTPGISVLRIVVGDVPDCARNGIHGGNIHGVE